MKALKLLVLPLAVTAAVTAMPAQAQTAPAPAANPFDFTSWLNMMGGMGGAPQGQVPGLPGAPMWNLARPSGYATFMNPNTWASMMNPATYAQFMTPQFYMQFANPSNLLSWLNPGEYMAYLNPMTYLNMMNPMAYMSFLNPMTYLAPMNPMSYVPLMGAPFQWLNPQAYSFSSAPVPAGTAAPAATFNWFDPNAWAQMFQQQTAPAAPAAAPAK